MPVNDALAFIAGANSAFLWVELMRHDSSKWWVLIHSVAVVVGVAAWAL